MCIRDRTSGTQSCWHPGSLWTGGTQSLWPHGTLLTVPCGLAELSTYGPLGTVETGGTKYFWPPRYPVDWWDLVLSAPQVPYGLVDSSPYGHQVTLELEDMAGHAYQEMYIVYHTDTVAAFNRRFSPHKT